MNKSQSTGMYIILAIMVLAFISMLFNGPATNTQELSYSKFVQMAETGDIKSVDIDKEYLIAIPTNQPETVTQDVNVHQSPLMATQKPSTLQYKVLIPRGADIVTKLEEFDKNI